MKTSKRVICLTIALACALIFPGCALQQKNTHTSPSTILPVKVDGLVVIYEPTNFGRPDIAAQPDREQKAKDFVVSKLGETVFSVVRNGLLQVGIPAKFVVADADMVRQMTGVSPVWRRIIVTPIRDLQTCNMRTLICVHRITAGVRLLAADMKSIVWSTEVEEPTIVGGPTDGRFLPFAGMISNAILEVVVANASVK